MCSQNQYYIKNHQDRVIITGRPPTWRQSNRWDIFIMLVVLLLGTNATGQQKMPMAYFTGANITMNGDILDDKCKSQPNGLSILAHHHEQSLLNLPLLKTRLALTQSDSISSNKPNYRAAIWFRKDSKEPYIGHLFEALPTSLVLANIPEDLESDHSLVRYSYDTIPAINIDRLSVKRRNAFLRGGGYGSVAGFGIGLPWAAYAFGGEWGLLPYVILPTLTGSVGFLIGGIIGEIAGTTRMVFKGNLTSYRKQRQKLDEKSVIKHLN